MICGVVAPLELFPPLSAPLVELPPAVVAPPSPATKEPPVEVGSDVIVDEDSVVVLEMEEDSDVEDDVDESEVEEEEEEDDSDVEDVKDVVDESEVELVDVKDASEVEVVGVSIVEELVMESAMTDAADVLKVDPEALDDGENVETDPVVVAAAKGVVDKGEDVTRFEDVDMEFVKNGMMVNEEEALSEVDNVDIALEGVEMAIGVVGIVFEGEELLDGVVRELALGVRGPGVDVTTGSVPEDVQKGCEEY